MILESTGEGECIHGIGDHHRHRLREARVLLSWSCEERVNGVPQEAFARAAAHISGTPADQYCRHGDLRNGKLLGCEIANLGHGIRPIPPVYVKPFVKRQKNDAADAEAIAEVAAQSKIRFVTVKTEGQQVAAMIFHIRDFLIP